MNPYQPTPPTDEQSAMMRATNALITLGQMHAAMLESWNKHTLSVFISKNPAAVLKAMGTSAGTWLAEVQKWQAHFETAIPGSTSKSADPKTTMAGAIMKKFTFITDKDGNVTASIIKS